MYAIKTIIPPQTEPLTLTEAKNYLRTDEDISALIVAAREYCEGYQNKKYITQTLELILDAFPCKNEIEFASCSPIQSVTSVKYFTPDNIEHIFDSSNYFVDTDSFVSRIMLGYCKLWPLEVLRPANAVIVRFIAGYGNASAVPETVKQAMVLHMRLLHDDYKPDERERLERARDALLGTKRRVPV